MRDASADQVFFGLASSLDFVRPSVDEIQNKNLFTLAEREERGGGEERRREHGLNLMTENRNSVRAQKTFDLQHLLQTAQ